LHSTTGSNQRWRLSQPLLGLHKQHLSKNIHEAILVSLTPRPKSNLGVMRHRFAPYDGLQISDFSQRQS